MAKAIKMTSMERVMAALRGEDHDVCPAVSLTSVATIDGMERSGAGFPAAHTDGAKMAALASIAHDVYGFDSVAPYYSIHLEAAVMGAEVDWSDRYHIPFVRKPPLKRLGDLKIPGDFLSHPLLGQLFKSLRLLQRQYGGEVPVVGKVVGPWTLLYHLCGVENLLLDTILEPRVLTDALNDLTDILLPFAEAQFEAGADLIVWAEHTTSDLVSAQIYEEMVFPVHRKAARTLDKCGPTVLHVCGNVSDRFELFARTGFTCFHMDSRNQIRDMVRRAEGRIQIAGCINNPVTLSQGSLVRVRREVEKNVSEGVALISPECAVPASVPGENLRELVKAAHNCRR